MILISMALLVLVRSCRMSAEIDPQTVGAFTTYDAFAYPTILFANRTTASGVVEKVRTFGRVE